MRTTMNTRDVLGGLMSGLRSLAIGIIPAFGSRSWCGRSPLLLSLCLTGLVFAPAVHANQSQAPTQITFEILQMTCGEGAISYEFFLNSTSLGTFVGDNT